MANHSFSKMNPLEDSPRRTRIIVSVGFILLGLLLVFNSYIAPEVVTGFFPNFILILIGLIFLGAGTKILFPLIMNNTR